MFYFIMTSILFMAANILDWYLTKRILDKGGQELNPILKKFGIARVKLIVCPILLLSGYLLHWAILVIPILMVIGACVWNYRILKKIDANT